MTKRPTESRGGVKGGLRPFSSAPCGVKGRSSLVGFGATPQPFLAKSIQRKKSTRRRQRSVPASNFALPQERPQAALSTLLHIVAPNGRDRPSHAAQKSSRTRRPAAFICLIHFAQCFSFGSMSAKYARTCSGGHASFDMCGTRNAINSSSEPYANSPSV